MLNVPETPGFKHDSDLSLDEWASLLADLTTKGTGLASDAFPV